MVLSSRAANREPVLSRPSGPLLIVLSGPSGVGKHAAVERMKEREPARQYAITATTREPRRYEVRGVHHHFWSRERFEEQVKENQLLEWSEVYGHWYGVPREEVVPALRAGKDVVLRLDVQGAATIKSLFPQAILIFLAPYHMDELSLRQSRLGAERPQELHLRLSRAPEELAQTPRFDYVVVNRQGELVRTVAQIESIISAEKCRSIVPVVSV